MSFRDATKVALRDLFEQQGLEGAVQVIREALESKEIAPEKFSIKEIWEACEPGRSVQEAVSSDMFPTITGEIINAKVIEAYTLAAAIGDKITMTIPSNLKTERMVGFDASEMPEEVLEGGEYNDSDLGEKYITSDNKKYGRLISVTEEAILFDRTGQLLNRAMKIGEKAALYREKLIVEAVQDINSDAWKPSGTATAVYRTAKDMLEDGTVTYINSASSNPFGEAGLEKFLELSHKMKDEEGDPIFIPEDKLIVLVPIQLWVQAKQMQKSTLVPEGMENAVNIFKGAFTPLTSPYISKQNATTWYAGDFAKDFIWFQVWPLMTMSANPGSGESFRRDIKSYHKVRFFGSCAAADYRHSYKFTG